MKRAVPDVIAGKGPAGPRPQPGRSICDCRRQGRDETVVRPAFAPTSSYGTVLCRPSDNPAWQLTLHQVHELARCRLQDLVRARVRVGADPGHQTDMRALRAFGTAPEHASEGTVLLAGRGILQHALRFRRGARGHVCGTRPAVALRRAHGPFGALNRGLDLIAMAGWLLVVALPWRRRRGRRGRRGRRPGRRSRPGLATHHGVRRLHVDAAFSRTSLPLQADEALLAPGGPPRVFHFPVVLTAVGAVAHREDTVIELCA